MRQHHSSFDTSSDRELAVRRGPEPGDIAANGHRGVLDALVERDADRVLAVTRLFPPAHDTGRSDEAGRHRKGELQDDLRLRSDRRREPERHSAFGDVLRSTVEHAHRHEVRRADFLFITRSCTMSTGEGSAVVVGRKRACAVAGTVPSSESGPGSTPVDSTNTEVNAATSAYRWRGFVMNAIDRVRYGQRDVGHQRREQRRTIATVVPGQQRLAIRVE
jgi:hypothetical protein